MDKDACIKQLEDENTRLKKRIAELEGHWACLERHVAELERRLGMNSRNSSKPPSSDMPGVPAAPPKRRRRKRGARKGHSPHLRELLPQERVKKRIVVKPEICPCGGTHLEETDEPPLRHQKVDIPPIQPDVTEYVQPYYRCKDCGLLIHQALPDAVKRQHFGPGVLALVGILTGMLNTSKRKALAVMNEVFSVPMSLGGLSHCEAQLAETLEQPYRETAAFVQAQPVAHADETGWRRGNRRRGWLWTLCCAQAAVFMIHAKRGREALQRGFQG